MNLTRASVDSTVVGAAAAELALLLDALATSDGPPDDACVQQAVAATRALRVQVVQRESVASFLGRLLQILEDVESGTIPWSNRVNAVLRVAYKAITAWQHAVTSVAGNSEAATAAALQTAEHDLETAEGALAAWRRTQQGPPPRGVEPDRNEGTPAVEEVVASLQRFRSLLADGGMILADRERIAVAGEIAQLQEVMQAVQLETTSKPVQPLEGLRNHCEGALRHLVEAAAQEVLDEARERGLRLALSVTGHVDPVDQPLGAALLEILTHLWSDSLECQAPRAAAHIDTVLRSEEARLVVEIGDPEAGTPWRDSNDDDVLGRYPGLKRVRPFVEALQGLVWVEPADVSGCRFRVTLPLASQAPHALVVRVGRHEVALPASAVAGVYDAHALHTSGDAAGAYVSVDGVRVPILHLAFHLGDVSFDELMREHVVVVGSCERRAALFAAGDRRTAHGFLKGEVTGMWAGGLETEFGTFPMLHVGNLLGRNAASQAVESRPAVVTPVREKQRPRTVLVVDSSEIEREHLSAVVAEVGHEVVAVQSAAEAWSTLETRPVDLVICDLRLPEMNAQQLGERRRAAAKFKQVPVLLILSHAGEQAHLVVQQLGATAWVRSPLQREDVVAAIARLVRA